MLFNNSYPSPANVKIYIGGVYIDDAFRVDWQAQNPKTPMYSWADSQYRAVAQGREIVSGRLLINYRFPGYLLEAMRNNRQIMTPTEAATAADLKTAVDAMHYGSAAERIDALMIANEKVGGKDLRYYEAALKAINTPMHRDHKKTSYQAGAQPPFDIKITYGDVEKTHTSKTLVDCHITGEAQVISGSATGGGDMSSSGSPIYETYSFFCRSIEEAHEQGIAIPSSNT